MITILAETAGNMTRMETLVTALPYVSGALVVFLTLAILWGVCALTAWLVKTLVPAAVLEPAAPAVARATEPVSAAGSVPPEIVAVIAAAIHTAVGKEHKIVAIKPQASSWEKAGRQSVLGSHRVR